MARDPIERFHESYRVDPSGCWLWQRAIEHKGYGLFKWDGRNIMAHRFAYLAFVGGIPAGFLVMHRCDVRACVNPEHLMIGTEQDNATDMCQKVRQARGRKNHTNKLTEAEVLEIRKAGGGTTAIGRRFGVSAKHIQLIKERKRWGWL